MRRLPPSIALTLAGMAATSCRHEPAALPTISGTAFPRSVRFANGRQIRIESAPAQVYLASTTVVDFAAALLPPERVAGLCAQAHTASILALTGERWRHLPSHERFVAEPVLALRPDLVLCSDYNDANSIAALERAGLPVLSLPATNSLADALAVLQLLGQAFGAEVAAATLLEQCRARQQHLLAKVATPRRRALCFTHNPTGSWTGGRNTMHAEALRLAGLDNAADHLDGHVPITSEQLLALDPDVLVLDLPIGPGRSSLQLLRENSTLARLRALRAGQVVELPAALYATGSHHVLDAAERIVAALAELARETKR